MKKVAHRSNEDKAKGFLNASLQSLYRVNQLLGGNDDVLKVIQDIQDFGSTLNTEG